MGYRFTDLTAACHDDWRAYVEHDFVCRLGDGTLEEGAFRHYLQQDYLFLIHFARAYALAAYKSRTLADLRQAHAGLKAILDVELQLHVDYCRQWGIGEEALAALPEARATMAYTRFVLESGLRGDLLDLHVALAPCVIGYAEIAAALAKEPGALADANPYREWIGEYAGAAYQEVAAAARRHLDRLAALSLTEARRPRLQTLFAQATRLEADFWQMGLDRAD